MSALAFNNPRVQQLRRLLGRRSARHDDGRFVVEGPVLVGEAVAAGWRCDAQFVAAEADRVTSPGIEGAGPVFELAGGVLDRVASTETPQDPLAVVAIPERDADELLATAQFAVVLDRVGDPGNLGTILRSAEAAGADLVVLTPGSVDPYNPKVVRASAGALFHVPVVEASLEAVAAAGLEVVGTTSHGSTAAHVENYTDADLRGRLAIAVGNEAHGLDAETTEITEADRTGPITRWVTIPHRGRSESLNVAMAATVLLFEAARQRAATPSGSGQRSSNGG